MMPQEDLGELLTLVRSCRACEASLPLGPRPILRVSQNARLLVVGQAPGTRVHETGIPWNDPSGDRLREWLQLPRESFYDESQVAIVPMGLCYPGRGKSGDLPPRKECAELWLERILRQLHNIRLTLLIGQYAQGWYLGSRRKESLTATVASWRDFLPNFFPLPHPSPRNLMWLRRNDWFEAEVVPALRQRAKEALYGRLPPHSPLQ